MTLFISHKFLAQVAAATTFTPDLQRRMLNAAAAIAWCRARGRPTQFTPLQLATMPQRVQARHFGGGIVQKGRHV